jgi:hypothetical protein
MTTQVRTTIHTPRKWLTTLSDTSENNLRYWHQDATMITLAEWGMPSLPTAVATELERLSELPANWDGNGITPLNPTTVERTWYVLGLAYLFGGSDLPTPFMSSSRDGRMILEWETEPGRELIIDVPESLESQVRFLLVEPNEEGEETEIESEISDSWSIQGIVRRLMANPRTDSILAPAATVGSNRTNDS